MRATKNMTGGIEMKKKLLAIIVSCIAVAIMVCIAGCSSSNTSSDESGSDRVQAQQPSEPAPLEIVESGYSIVDGYIMYGIAIHNPNDNYEAQYPSFNIVGKSSDGSIVSSDKQVGKVIFPGETVYFALQAGHGTEPNTVEFSLLEPDWVEGAPIGPEGFELFTISNTNEVTNKYGETSFTGELTANADIDSKLSKQAQVELITRDEAGNINYGQSTYVDIPRNGESIPFEISTYGDSPEYASYEIHAQIW